MFTRDPATGDFVIGGKRVPAMVVGIVIAGAALLFVLRLRSKGSSAGVGKASPAVGQSPSPYEVYDPTTGLPVGYSQDQLAIAELSNAVNSLQNELDASGQLNAASSSSTSGSSGGTASTIYSSSGSPAVITRTPTSTTLSSTSSTSLDSSAPASTIQSAPSSTTTRLIQ